MFKQDKLDALTALLESGGWRMVKEKAAEIRGRWLKLLLKEDVPAQIYRLQGRLDALEHLLAIPVALKEAIEQEMNERGRDQ